MQAKDLLKKYNNPKNFFNRDLSWIEFNRRVLEEAINPQTPLLEKVKFLSIFSSNLDEFYMIRISGLKEQVIANVPDLTIDGLTPIEQIQRIEKEILPMLKIVKDIWTDEIIPGLRQNNIIIASIDEDFSPNEQKLLNDYFKKEIFPVLTPLAFDPGRPFPYISNLSLSLAVVVRKPTGKEHFARVKVPNILSRLIHFDDLINSEKKTVSHVNTRFVWVGDLIKINLYLLFPGMEILQSYRFRTTRDTDIELQEDEADDLLQVIEENIRQRRFGSVVRLEIASDMPDHLQKTLIKNLEITKEDVQSIEGPLGMSDVIKLCDLPFHNLKDKPHHPVIPSVFEGDENIFSKIKKRDILIHHPYHSFSPVIDFIKTASLDPDVLAIKQTLYRVGANSPIVGALIEAAQRGKQVAVLVELKARFDEENNIYWARELEKVGVHVIYGLVGLKTHAKMALIVRKENDGVKRYVHLGTGNYNSFTAKIYTDIGLFTANEDICADVSDLFNYLTGYSNQKDFRKLFVAPINMKEKFLRLIGREIENVKAGGKGHLIFKFNSLVDPILIAALYEASNCGIKIELIVRGICCLIPGVSGLSENIKVVSIVGRYLEHSRIFYFYNNGSEDIYLSSADLMPRNLYRRVEIAFPLTDDNLKQYLIKTVLNVSLKDNVKARQLKPDGKYVIPELAEDARKISSQEWLMNFAIKESKNKIKQKIIRLNDGVIKFPK